MIKHNVSLIGKFYTTWTLIILLFSMGLAGLGYKVSRGIWRGAFSLFAGAAVTGTIFMWIYHAEIAQRYFPFIQYSSLVVFSLDILFHIIPLVLLIRSIPWMRRRCNSVNRQTNITMLFVVLITSLSYLNIFGTTLYPAPSYILIPLAITTTLIAMFRITA